MKLRRLAALALLAATAPLATALATAARQPDLRSNAFYVVDDSGSKVLAARRETVVAPIASITKLMTALVVLEAKQPLDEKIVISRADLQQTAGNASRLAAGARISRGDLLHLALMSSENRAANALCGAYPGGRKACVSAMNRKAKALGMKTARFVEPTGLSSGNVSSPVDLARLVRAAAANPAIRRYSTDAEHAVTIKGRTVEFRSTNSLVRKPDWRVTVQKTGYNAEAGRCLVMQAISRSTQP